MLGRTRGYFAFYPSKALRNELAQRPPGAVARKHGKIVEMDLAVAVRVGGFAGINIFKPVIRGNGAAVMKDKPAQGIIHV
jgi:hypothetical protein